MRAKLDFGAEIDILSGPEFDHGVSRLSEQIKRLDVYGLKHLRIPILQGNVPGGGGTLTLGSQSVAPPASQPGSPPYCGPQQGFAWRVVRVSVFGLSTGDIFSLYFGEPAPQRYVGSYSVNGPEWDSGHGLLLHPGDYLVLQGTSANGGEQITLNGEVIEAPAELVYKLIG